MHCAKQTIFLKKILANFNNLCNNKIVIRRKEKKVEESMRNPLKYDENNITGTFNPN